MADSARNVCVNGTYPDWHPAYEGRRIVGGALLVLGILVIIVGTGCMLWRRNYQPLRARSISLVLLCGVGTLTTQLVRVGVSEFVTAPKMPCDVAFMATMLFPIFAGAPMVLRIIRLYHMYKVQRRKLGYESGGDRASFLRLQKALRQETRWTSPLTLNLVFVVTSLPSVIAMIWLYRVDDRLGNGCFNCGSSFAALSVNLVVGLANTVVTLWALYRTRLIVDSFFLRREIVHWATVWIFIIVITVPLEAIPVMVDIQTRGWFSASILVLFGAFATMVVSVILPTLATFDRGCYALQSGGSFQLVDDGKHVMNPMMPGGAGSQQRSHYSVRRTSDPQGTSLSDAVLLNGKATRDLTLPDFLNHPAGHRAFTEHLMTEFSVENIKFWGAVNHFRDHFHEGEPGRMAALLIYEIYVEEDGPLAVNVSSSQREAVEAMVQDAEQCHSHMFDECQTEILRLMERDSFPRFQRSVIYRDLLVALQRANSEAQGRASMVPSLGPRYSPRQACCCCRPSRRLSDQASPPPGNITPTSGSSGPSRPVPVAGHHSTRPRRAESGGGNHSASVGSSRRSRDPVHSVELTSIPAQV